MTTIFYGDCLEKMKSIADKSVDLIICDLPFGCLTNQKGESRGFRRPSHIGTDLEKRFGESSDIGGCSWDIKIDLKEFWKQVKRIRKDNHTPTILFTTTKYGFELYNSNPKEFRYDLVWDKGRGVSFLTANKMPMRSHEMIYVFSKAGAKYNRVDIKGDFEPFISGLQKGGVKQYGGVEKIQKENDGSTRCILSVIQNKTSATRNGHPTEKPIELYKFLIERYSNKNDVVLDPTFGSGNSGLASRLLERRYIGIEKDNNFFWKFAKKISSSL
jgi:site-specific DNA-methyltransferase (adenine-specific)